MSKIVIMFPGQASQYVGMAKEWMNRYKLIGERFKEASEVLGFDLARLCFEGPVGELKKTENTQVALVASSTAMFEALVKEEGIMPSYLAGHSIGEISALTAAGVFNYSDAVKLARIRGEAMASCNADNKAGMMAVKNISANLLETLLQELDPEKKSVEIANYNSTNQTILSGNLKELNRVGDILKIKGARVIPLNVSGPFHSRYMKPATTALSNALKSLKLNNMKYTVMCGHKGRLYTQGDDIKESLVAQLTAPIRWTTVLSELKNLGVDEYIETGPKDVLKNLTIQTIEGVKVYSYDVKADRALREADINQQKMLQYKNLKRFLGLCLGAAVVTRNTNWDEKAYQEGVVEPYRTIQRINEKVEQEDRPPTQEEMKSAVTLLKTIFITKGVPVQQSAERLQNIYKSTGTEDLFAE